MHAGKFTRVVQYLKFASSSAEPGLLCESIGRHFPQGTRATQPVGGLLLWVELPPSVDSADLFHAALKDHIVIIPGQLYSNGARYRQCIRISCCLELDAPTVDAVRRLGELAKPMARP